MAQRLVISLGTAVRIAGNIYRTHQVISKEFEELNKRYLWLKQTAKLRIQLLDLFCDRPRVSFSSYSSYLSYSSYGESIEEIIELVLGRIHRRFGVAWEMEHSKDSNDYKFRTTTRDITLVINCYAAKDCPRVKTGTRFVEAHTEDVYTYDCTGELSEALEKEENNG